MKRQTKRFREVWGLGSKSLVLIPIISVAVLWQALPVAAQTSVQIDSNSAKSTPVDVSVGHSSLLRFVSPIDRASVNNPAIADVVVISPTQLLVHGKEAGSTSLVVWHAQDNEFFNLNVISDLESLDQVFSRLFPDETILTSSAAGSLILSGRVKSNAVVHEAEVLAQNYSGNVINLLHVEKQPIAELLHELFPQVKIKAVQTHDGIILSGEVPTQEHADSVVNVARLYDKNVTNLMVIEGKTAPRFKDMLAKLLPDESIDAHETADGTIILTGRAKHPANVIKAEKAAKAAGGNVVNLVDISDQKQVLIEVRFLEVSRSLSESFGFNFLVQGPDFTAGSFTGTPLSPQLPTTPQFSRLSSTLEDLMLSDAVNQVLEFRGGTDISTALSMLKDAGLIRILAEPNLIAMSGEKANFLAGGEFPIPVAQTNGATTIEFREFGIGLNFEPVVSSDDVITMQVDPEVSVLDFGPAAVTLSGFSVPALITRRASTRVQMKPGESLVIGGLLSRNDTTNERRIPMLGDIPVLGKLFASESFRNEETELVVIVTPRLRQPQLLNTPERLADNELINEAMDSHMVEPPLSQRKEEAIRAAIMGARVVPPEVDPSEGVDPGPDELESFQTLPEKSSDVEVSSQKVFTASISAGRDMAVESVMQDAVEDTETLLEKREIRPSDEGVSVKAEYSADARVADADPNSLASKLLTDQEKEDALIYGEWEQDAPGTMRAADPSKQKDRVSRENYNSGVKVWNGRI